MQFHLQFDALHFCMSVLSGLNGTTIESVPVRFAVHLFIYGKKFGFIANQSCVPVHCTLMRHCCNRNKHHISIITAICCDFSLSFV